MTERQAISKKTRFEIFKRDGFVCAYCGAHPPEVLLEVDHVIAVAEGGTNDPDNLVTACENCNRGKGARSLSVVPQSLSEKADQVADREEQIRAYSAIMQEAKDRRDQEMWDIANIFMERWGDDTILRSYLGSIRMFLSRLSFPEVQEAMELATDRMPSSRKAFKYFSGVCWRKIKGTPPP